MRYLLLVPVFIYVGASLWANFDLFPEDFMQYWWFDDLGHILVFGSLAATAIAMAHIKQIPVFATVSSIVVLSIVDEFSQLFLTYRSFSYQDLLMSLFGIGFAFVSYILIKAALKNNNLQ